MNPPFRSQNLCEPVRRQKHLSMSLVSLRDGKNLCPSVRIPLLLGVRFGRSRSNVLKIQARRYLGRPVLAVLHGRIGCVCCPGAGLRVGDRAVIARRPTRSSSWRHGVGLRAVAARSWDPCLQDGVPCLSPNRSAGGLWTESPVLQTAGPCQGASGRRADRLSSAVSHSL